MITNLLSAFHPRIEKMNSISVMIIDDQELFRAKVRQTIAHYPDINVRDYAPSQNTMHQIEAIMPDVALLGCHFSVYDSLGLADQIAQQFPSVKVIVMTPDPNDEELFAVIKSSAVACLNKSASVESLMQTIQRALAGEYPINDAALTQPKVASRVLRQFDQLVFDVGDNPAESVFVPITKREVQVLSCIAEGYSNKQVAALFNISEQTIKNHMSAILRKLNANDRAHAVTMAIRNNWISV
jgi:two-component system, NarL family, response regulator DegU